MGVPQSYYAPSAAWLADRGVAVLCFDYRGMGNSRPSSMKRSLRGLDADVQTWDEQDAAAALTWFRVMAQWRRWCLSPDDLMSEPGTDWRERYARIRNPMLVLSFTDDEFMSERNTESLHGFYTGAPKTMRRIAPSDIGEQRVGHFGAPEGEPGLGRRGAGRHT